MGRRVFALSMLAGVGLIVSQPHLFLSPTLGCFHCDYTEAEFIRDTVARTAAVFIMVLIPAALAFRLWRRVICLRGDGTVSVTHDQGVALVSNHRGLRVLSNATAFLALIAGGLIVQLGYMSSQMPF